MEFQEKRAEDLAELKTEFRAIRIGRVILPGSC